MVPASEPGAVTESDRPVSEAEGVQLVRAENGRAVFEVGAGRYRFSTPWQ